MGTGGPGAAGPGTTALVTGIVGQDGAYLTRLLVGRGVRVVGLTPVLDVPAELAGYLAGAELRPGDLRDADGLAALVAEVRPDHVYNLAGLSSVAQSWTEPVLVGDVNGLGVVRLLEAVRAYAHADPPAGGVRLVQASSAEIFGHPGRHPQDEDTPLRPVSPYGLAKAYAHDAVRLYRASHGLHASNVVLYNHESPLRPPAFVTRKITRGALRIAQGRQTELVLGNLDVSRDWGFAGDYVRAMVLAAEHPVPGDYVVASGRLHTLRDLLDAAFAAAGLPDWSGYVRSDPAFFRPADPAVLVGDPSRARRELGWEPQVSFDELVRIMVDADRGPGGPAGGPAPPAR